jgi:hypothetical protein
MTAIRVKKHGMNQITESDRHRLSLSTVSYTRWRPGLGILIRTSLGRPKWYRNEGRDLPTVWALTPRGWYLRAEPEKYEHAYLSQLRGYGIGAITEELQAIADEQDTTHLVIGCFEGDRRQCHRGLFSDWWQTETGEHVPEATT